MLLVLIKQSYRLLVYLTGPVKIQGACNSRSSVGLHDIASKLNLRLRVKPNGLSAVRCIIGPVGRMKRLQRDQKPSFGVRTNRSTDCNAKSKLTFLIQITRKSSPGRNDNKYV